MPGTLSHLHRAGSKNISTLENKWLLIKSCDENKTLIFPFILHASSEITWLYQIKPEHKMKRNIWRGVLGFIAMLCQEAYRACELITAASRGSCCWILGLYTIFRYHKVRFCWLGLLNYKPEDNPMKGESKPRSILSVVPQSPGRLKAIYKNNHNNKQTTTNKVSLCLHRLHSIAASMWYIFVCYWLIGWFFFGTRFLSVTVLVVLKLAL